MNSPRRDAERRKGGSGNAHARARRHVLAALVVLTGLARTEGAAAAAPWSREVSVALLAGSAQPVGTLADYQWDVRPQAAWGAQALAGLGPFAAGLRWWSSSTTQSLGLSGQADARVHANSFELVARARVASWHVFSLHATATGGRLGLGFDPDHVTVDTGGTPVEVELAPLQEWVGGAGLALEAPLPGDWGVGLEGERRVYALDTAHRSGSGVVYARETFGDWSARFALRRTWNL